MGNVVGKAIIKVYIGVNLSGKNHVHFMTCTGSDYDSFKPKTIEEQMLKKALKTRFFFGGEHCNINCTICSKYYTLQKIMIILKKGDLFTIKSTKEDIGSIQFEDKNIMVHLF